MPQADNSHCHRLAIYDGSCAEITRNSKTVNCQAILSEPINLHLRFFYVRQGNIIEGITIHGSEKDFDFCLCANINLAMTCFLSQGYKDKSSTIRLKVCKDRLVGLGKRF